MNQQAQQNNDDITEAYKAVIDFNKVVMSISSTILAAIITYIVSQDLPFKLNNFVSPVLLIASFICCLFGFGRSISAIQKNEPRPIAKRFSNFGGALMLLGIIAICFLNKGKEKKIDDILKEIQKSSLTLDCKLLSKYCDSIELKEKTYTFKYHYDSIFVLVDYSLDKDRILLLNKSVVPKPQQQMSQIIKKRTKTKKKRSR